MTGFPWTNNLTSAELVEKQMATNGFPGDKRRGSMWSARGPISKVGDHRVFYMADTYGGQSGSPVYVDIGDGKKTVVAVHARGGCPNSAVRLHNDHMSSIKDQLTKWDQGHQDDPCEIDKGGCSHFCRSKGTKAICYCWRGFMLMPDKKTCKRKPRPCDKNNGGCTHSCVNRGRKALCRCWRGFKLMADKKSCQKTCWRRCKRRLRPVCASNGKTYFNKCVFKMVQCRQKKKNIILTIKSLGKYKACWRRYRRIYRPVCGSNGITYKNNCIFEIAECREKAEGHDLTVYSPGRCTEDWMESRNAEIETVPGLS